MYAVEMKKSILLKIISNIAAPFCPVHVIGVRICYA